MPMHYDTCNRSTWGITIEVPHSTWSGVGGEREGGRIP